MSASVTRPMRSIDASAIVQRMTFLRARHTPETETFWWDLRFDVSQDATREHVPQLLRELAAGDRSVVCDRAEGEAALAWARAQAYWPTPLAERQLPLYMLDTNAE